VSCSVYDVVRLEWQGVQTANLGTEPFLDEGLEQARVLGMPDYRMVWVPHPVATCTAQEVGAIARQYASNVVARLTGRG
jgi:hypothetical protein